MAKNWDLEKHGKKVNQAEKKKKKTKKKKGCSVVLLLFSLAIFAGLGMAIGILYAFLSSSGDIDLEEYMINNISTVFYDKDGNQIGVAHNGENRSVVNLSEIPLYLQKATIAIEDERFYEHNGIDYKRTAGAIYKYITTLGKGSYGGSTITQQLVKNATGDRERSVVRKVREWWKAILLERELSKDQILELYLNTVYFGPGAYGVQAASTLFFDKDVSDLTLAESAMLIGVTNAPTKYSPLTNFDNAKSRQEVILGKMKELGYIDQAMYDEAIAEEIKVKKGTLSTSSTQSYFVDMVIEDVINDLEEQKGIKRGIASNMIFGGGLKIYTTMDSDIQAIIDDVYVNQEDEVFKAFASDPEDDKIQSAMVILDQKNGHIVGIAGGRGEKTEERGFNFATMAYRQPGSTIKPIAIYGPAINDGLISASTIISDTPITINIAGSEPWSPSNWYKAGFYGNITIRYAVEQSSNIPAVRVLYEKIGLNRAYQALLDVGITSLQSADKNYAPLSLGGLTKGVSVREWAGAYGMIANSGVYNKPISYTKVVDSKGQTILENKKSSKRVMTEEAAYVMTDILKGVVTRGTATTARLSGMTSAGKTGSTSDTKDKWYVGYTPYYVGAVWTGYEEPKTISGGGEICKQIWKKVMERVHKDLPNTDFTKPGGIEYATICNESGMLNTVYCGSNIKTDMFTVGTAPTEYCTIHGLQIETTLTPEPVVESEYPEGY